MDSSPTKAWVVLHRADPQLEMGITITRSACGPAEELYDLRNDPDQIKNVAAQAGYAKTREELSTRLMKALTDAGDPRVTGDGTTFDRPPFTLARGAAEGGKAKNKKAKKGTL